MWPSALLAHHGDMHPELSSSVAQIRFRELDSRRYRRGPVTVASDVSLPPPRRRDRVGRDRHIA
jgi:hypothetical protein